MQTPLSWGTVVAEGGLELAAHWRGEVLRTFTAREPRSALAVLAKEIAHEGGALLGDLSQHPANRLADEELLLVEHRRRDLREEREVATAAPQRAELREERGPANPEVLVLGPD